MSKRSLSTRGFASVAIVAAIAALVIIGGSGAYVYHHNHKAKVVTTTTVRSTSTDSTKSTQSANTAANPYAGWKTYTSSEEKASFKYPSNWTADPQGQYTYRTTQVILTI